MLSAAAGLSLGSLSLLRCRRFPFRCCGLLTSHDKESALDINKLSLSTLKKNQ